MSFGKIRTIKVSERVFDIVCEELDILQTNYGKKIDGYLSTFNNCREQGYYLTIESTDYESNERTKGRMVIWVFEHRNGDSIVVVISNDYPRHNGMFDETAYEKRVCFGYDELQQSADYILIKIKKYFMHELG